MFKAVLAAAVAALVVTLLVVQGGRYAIVSAHENGAWRIDRMTGAVSFCGWRPDNWEAFCVKALEPKNLKLVSSQ